MVLKEFGGTRNVSQTKVYLPGIDCETSSQTAFALHTCQHIHVLAEQYDDLESSSTDQSDTEQDKK